MIKRLLCPLSLTLTVAFAANAWANSAIELPDIGESSAATLSQEEEERLGRSLMQEIRQTGKLLDDLELNAYISNLGHELLSHSERAGSDFHFFIINDPAVNAFALPGGYVGVHSGLIMATRSENELASVVAHEIAHVSQRHIARSFEKVNELNLPMTAAVIAAILLSGQNAQLGEAALAASIAGSSQMQLDFTRSNEQEADRVGMQLLASAGYDPRSMPAFFERLEQESRYYANSAPEFLRTHPVTGSRIADSLNRAEQYPVHTDPPSESYGLAKARLRVLTASDPKALVSRMAAEARNGSTNGSSSRYGYALALLASGETAKARTAFTDLLKTDPTRLGYLLGLAESQAAGGDYAQALETYRKALSIYPHNPPLTLGYSHALLNAGKAPEAARTLRELAGAGGQSISGYYQLLARAEAESGNEVASQIALAQHYHQSGDIYGAITQLEMARRNRLDFYHAARIDAMLEELKREAPPPRSQGKTQTEPLGY